MMMSQLELRRGLAVLNRYGRRLNFDRWMTQRGRFGLKAGRSWSHCGKLAEIQAVGFVKS